MAAATEQDPYLVLGVARNATNREIRAAYRALGAKYHPDRHQGNPLEELAGAKMAEINRAYEILSDPERRAAFDVGGGARGGGFTANQAPGPGFSSGGRAGRRLIQIVALLSLMPLVFRFGGLAFRALGALVREVFEGVGLLRGTPFAAGAALLGIAILLFALLRRRRGKARNKSDSPPPVG